MGSGWIPITVGFHHGTGNLQVLEALKERRTLPVSNALAQMAVGRDPKKVAWGREIHPYFTLRTQLDRDYFTSQYNDPY